MSENDWLARTRTSYDTVAASYADLLAGYLDRDPHDRGVLGWFAELVRDGGGGPVADVGCGPGHLTAHLHRLGLDAVGIDLSPAMVERARRDHPQVRFEVGSMTGLELGDASVAGVLAFYSLIHVPDEQVPAVLAELVRVLRPGGVLLLGFQVGDVARHLDQAYGHPVDVHSHRRPVERVASWVRAAGLLLEAEVVRDPGAAVPDARLLARRP